MPRILEERTREERRGSRRHLFSSLVLNCPADSVRHAVCGLSSSSSSSSSHGDEGRRNPVISCSTLSLSPLAPLLPLPSPSFSCFPLLRFSSLFDSGAGAASAVVVVVVFAADADLLRQLHADPPPSLPPSLVGWQLNPYFDVSSSSSRVLPAPALRAHTPPLPLP